MPLGTQPPDLILTLHSWPSVPSSLGLVPSTALHSAVNDFTLKTRGWYFRLFLLSSYPNQVPTLPLESPSWCPDSSISQAAVVGAGQFPRPLGSPALSTTSSCLEAGAGVMPLESPEQCMEPGREEIETSSRVPSPSEGPNGGHRSCPGGFPLFCVLPNPQTQPPTLLDQHGPVQWPRLPDGSSSLDPHSTAGFCILWTCCVTGAKNCLSENFCYFLPRSGRRLCGEGSRKGQRQIVLEEMS